MSPGSNRRIGRVCVGLQLLYSPVPVFFGSPLLAPLKCPKMVGPLSDAPFLIGMTAGIGHVFNLRCCGGRCRWRSYRSGCVGSPLLLDHHLDQLRYFGSRQITGVRNVGLDIRGKNERDTLLGSAVTDASYDDVAECS